MKKIYLFILSLFPIFLLRAGVFRLLFLTKFQTDPILITNLLGISFSPPYWIITVFGLINMLLIWLVVKNLFNSKIAFLAYFIYGVSPWTAYMEYSASVNVILLTCLLLFFFGLIMVKKRRALVGWTLTLIGFLSLVYCSLLSWLVLPFLVWGLVKTRYLNFSKNKYLLIAVLLSLPLLVFSLKNRQGLITTAKNQVTVFSDVGLINTVNVFQGENREVKPQIAARLTENRYTYSGLHLIYSTLNTLNPINYFTPQYKMLGFSLNPAILVGFLIPFSLGLFKLVKYLQRNLVGLTMFSLFIPSLLSKNNPDYARMFLFSPIIFLLIALGLNELLSLKNKRWAYLTIGLAIIQFLVVLIDIFIRELWRLYQLTGV